MHASIHKRSFKIARLELVWVTFAHAAIIALNVVIGLLVARHFSVDDYGRLSYFINIFGMLRLLAALGITSQITFELAQAQKQKKELQKQFYTLLIVRIVTIIGISLFIIGLGYILQDSILVIAGIASVLALFHDFGVGALQGLGKTRQVVGTLALQPILYALGIAIVIFGHMSINAVYIVNVLSFIPAVLFIGILTVKFIGIPDRSITLMRGIWSSLRFAGGMYSLAFAGSLFTSYATLYLGWKERFTDAALITIPLNIVFMTSTLVNATMTTAYFPRISRMYAEHDSTSAQDLFMLFYSLVSAVTTLVTVALMLYPKVVLGLLYGTRYQASAPLLSLIAPVAYLYTMQSVLTFTIVAQRRMRSSILGAFSSTIILLVAITFAANVQGDLFWCALAHPLSAVAGLVVQARLVGYGLRRLLIQTGKHLCVALTLFGLARLFIPDSFDNSPMAVIVLTALTVVYLVWIWHENGRKANTYASVAQPLTSVTEHLSSVEKT